MRTSRINVQKTIREKRAETKNVKWKNILNLKIDSSYNSR